VVRESCGVLEDDVIALSEALATGMSRRDVRRLVYSGRWQRLDRAVYCVSAKGGVADRVPGTMRRSRRLGLGARWSDPASDVTRMRRTAIRAAVLSLGPDAVAVYDTAADLHGMAGLRRDPTIHVSVPGNLAKVRTNGRVRVHQLSLPREAICHVTGIPVTTPLQTAAHVICRAERFPAVSILDSALNKGLLDPADLNKVLGLIRRRRGAVLGRQCIAEADGRAESPLETRVRLRCADGRVPPDDLQHQVRGDDGQMAATVDAAWTWARVAAEADGQQPHATPAALFEDRRRQNRLMNAGWTVLRFTWVDTLQPDYIPTIVRAALARSRSRHR
jgi:hypothetical protein